MQNKLIVHCSDSEFGNALLIDQWHRERGFDMIGYNWVILNGVTRKRSKYVDFLDGAIESGRPINRTGAHCKGKNSYYGVCLIGVDNFTYDQFNALESLVYSLEIRNEHIYGHNHFDKGKTCPNFDVAEWVSQNF